MNTARHLREIGYRRAEDDGWVCLHASAATMDGRGILVVGDSGAGKSTLALALAATPTGAFLPNDRTMITATPGEAPRAVAVPGPIRLNGGTRQAPGYASGDPWDLTRPQPTKDTDWQSFHGANKLHILPSEWHERSPRRPASRKPALRHPHTPYTAVTETLRAALASPASRMRAPQRFPRPTGFSTCPAQW